MVSSTEEDGIKEVRDADNNIIIINSTLRNILPPQLKNMDYQYNNMCGCECLISAKIMYYSLLTHHVSCLKHIKDISHNAQNRISSEISSRIFETYNNTVLPHGFHVYNTSADMSMATKFTCTSKNMRYRTLNMCCVVLIGA